ncbi:MAG: hypothetical protein LBJ11_05420 [Oscillospiraceae bacterium]|nr:hypothetical protein [Oscillospiraceae bacterium]
MKPDNNNVAVYARVSRITPEEKLAAFAAETERARQTLAALLAHIDDHSGIAPEDVTWASVETAHHINELLDEIAEFLGLAK